MFGLSVVDYIFVILGAVSLLIWMILFVKGNKYNSMFEVLPENEFRLKNIYGMGYAVLEMIGYNYKSKGDRKLRQELDVLYGEKYSEYYLRVIHSQQITIACLFRQATDVSLARPNAAQGKNILLPGRR